MNYNYSFYY